MSTQCCPHTDSLSFSAHSLLDEIAQEEDEVQQQQQFTILLVPFLAGRDGESAFPSLSNRGQWGVAP